MDQKKQALTPELKQIYDRVMNTQVTSKPETTPSAPVKAPTTPAAATNPPPANPQAPLTAPTEPAKSAMKITPPVGGPPTTPAMGSDKPFVFNGSKVTTPAGTTSVKVTTGGGGGKSLPGFVIAILIVVLLVVWGVFWAKLLQLF